MPFLICKSCGYVIPDPSQPCSSCGAVAQASAPASPEPDSYAEGEYEEYEGYNTRKAASVSPIKEPINVVLFIILLIIAAVYLVKLPGSSENITGRWEGEWDGLEVAFEFRADETMVMTVLILPIEGTYRTDGDELTMKIGDRDMICQFRRSGSTLTLINMEGETFRLERVSGR